MTGVSDESCERDNERFQLLRPSTRKISRSDYTQHKIGLMITTHNSQLKRFSLRILDGVRTSWMEKRRNVERSDKIQTDTFSRRTCSARFYVSEIHCSGEVDRARFHIFSRPLVQLPSKAIPCRLPYELFSFKY